MSAQSRQLVSQLFRFNRRNALAITITSLGMR